MATMGDDTKIRTAAEQAASKAVAKTWSAGERSVNPSKWLPYLIPLLVLCVTAGGLQVQVFGNSEHTKANHDTRTIAVNNQVELERRRPAIEKVSVIESKIERIESDVGEIKAEQKDTNKTLQEILLELRFIRSDS